MMTPLDIRVRTSAHVLHRYDRTTRVCVQNFVAVCHAV